MQTPELRLTHDAEQDLDDLYCVGFRTWGEKQADHYYDGLLRQFDRILENPRMYPAADDIRKGYRRRVFKRHAIYYIATETTVEIRAIVKHQNITARP